MYVKSAYFNSVVFREKTTISTQRIKILIEIFEYITELNTNEVS